MKLKLITLFPSILLILLLVNACKKRRDEPQPKASTIYGKVVNKKTGDPIKGAKMSFQDHEYFTPNSGEYHFQEMAGEYPLIVEHKDYDDSIFNVVLRSNKELIQDRPLKPIRSIVHATHQDDLHFESTTDTLIIEIENVGIEDSLVWKAESNRAWLIISPTDGTIHGEGSMSLEITIDIDQLTAEKDTGTVTITNGTYVEQSIEVSVCAEKDNIEVVENPTESLSEGLVAYYPFNGDANDESDNNNNGVVTGASLTTDRKGNINSAYIFNGSSDFIEVLHDNSLSHIGTIAVWVKPSNNTTDFIVEKTSSNIEHRYDYRLWIGRDKKIYFRVIDEGGEHTTIINDTDTELEEWIFVTAVYNIEESYLEIYVNGESAVKEFIEDINLRTSNMSLYIGKTDAGGSELAWERYYNGVIDDIRIYNRVLTEEEVILLYNE